MDIKTLKTKVKNAENKVAEINGSLQENEAQIKAMKTEIEGTNLPDKVKEEFKSYVDKVLANETVGETPLKAFIEENEALVEEKSSQIVNLLS